MSHANRKKLRISAAAAAGALAVAGTTLATSWAGIAQAAPAKPTAGHMADMPAMPAAKQAAYRFITLDNANDVTFNQLLGINGKGVIAGYFGSGAQGHPNKGYLLNPPYGQGNYVNENFPGSVQTQVTGLNDNGVTVGFWSSMNNANQVNDNFGFWAKNGVFHTADFPTGTPAKPPVDQLLGVNNHDVAVGFFTNSSGINRGYTYNINTSTFSRVLPPGATNSNLGASLTATGINNYGDVAGFYNVNATTVDAFLKLANGRFIKIAVAGASMTQAFGVNDSDWVVGTYTDGSGSTATTHGFIYKLNGGYVTGIDDPNGVGTTTINGINNEGDLVGFYTDSAGNTDGLLAYPGF